VGGERGEGMIHLSPPPPEPCEVQGIILHPILNYIEFRTNHAPYVVHGVVQGSPSPSDGGGD